MADQAAAPARATIHPTIAWPVITVITVFIGGWLYAYAGAAVFAPWWLLVAGPVLASLGGLAARTHWDETDYGVRHTRSGVWLARVAGYGAAFWLAWSGWATPGAALPLLALGALPLWLWFAVLSWRAPRQAQVMIQRYDQGRQITRDRSWRQILDRAGCDDVVITDVREHRGGLVLTVEPDPERDKSATYQEFAGRAQAIGTAAAMHYRRTGSPLPRNAVRPEPGSDDAEFLLNVSTRDVFAEATSYVPDYTPGDITRALDIGEFEDASRILISITGHMKIVGMTGAGKSVVANNLIARVSACANALVWVVATDKLIPLVWPWLRSWFEDRAVAPALDWVAGTSPHEVLKTLRGAYKLACDRNDRLTDESKHRPTGREPAVVVFVEETSHAVEFQDTIVTHDGQEVTVSDLLKMIAQAGRSADVWVVVLSQYALNAGLGDRSSELIRNLTQRICLRTMESHDGYRTLPGLPATVDTASIPLHTMFVQPNIEVARAIPGKAAELDGSTQIDPIAVRQAAWRPAGVEPESDLGPDYAGRWDQGRHPKLSQAVAGSGLAWRVPGATMGGDVAEQPRREPVRPTGGEGSGDVDTHAHGWTDEDDDALRALLDPDGEADRPRPFELPDPTEGLARLQRLADQMGGPPPDRSDCDDADRTGPDDGPDRSAEHGPGEPVPEPLGQVVRWLDAQEAAGVVHGPDHHYLTETIAIGIGAEGRGHALGLALARLGLRSVTVPREFDADRRKGYAVRALRERADRYRFGMP